jgi:hypothetical protein
MYLTYTLFVFININYNKIIKLSNPMKTLTFDKSIEVAKEFKQEFKKINVANDIIKIMYATILY